MTTHRPSIDHSILSPSGRVSKRARRAALERARVELFGPNGLERPGLPPQPSERERLLAHAARLRDLAARGMKSRAFIKEATRLETEAENLK